MKRLYIFIGIFTILFGLISLFNSSAILFLQHSSIQVIVPFILWGNFFLSFFYILGGVLILKKNEVSIAVSRFVALTSAMLLMSLMVYMTTGQPYELRTLFAMTLRTFVWLVVSLFCLNLIEKKEYL